MIESSNQILETQRFLDVAVRVEGYNAGKSELYLNRVLLVGKSQSEIFTGNEIIQLRTVQKESVSHPMVMISFSRLESTFQQKLLQLSANWVFWNESSPELSISFAACV